VGCLDRAEHITQVAAIVPAGATVVMALLGLAKARRQPAGRSVGTPYRRIPSVLYIVVGSLYTALTVGGWRQLPLRLPMMARWLCAVGGLSLYATGMGFIFLGRRALGTMYNLSTTTGVELYADHQLVTSGPFRWVRHPMYFGAFLAGSGALLLYRTWTMVFLFLHLPIYVMRAKREEEVLEEEFGDEWRAYRAGVRGGVPGLG
jgi:protein-S-isoprenylcysteine O-methyltransferase Ste14